MELIIFLIGLCIGSFTNVLIDRLPKGEDIFLDRSKCDFCKKTLRWYELVPLFSFLIQRGQCRRCHKTLSWQYPLVEFFVGIGFVGIYRNFFATADITLFTFVSLCSYWIIYLSLIVLFISDLKTFILPDSMIVLGIIGVLVQFFLLSFTNPISQIQILSHVASAVGATAFFFFLWVITKKKGMGFGDVKLVFLLGLILGFPSVIVAFYVAFLTGAGVGVILIMRRKKSLKSHVPFGPFLIFGFAVALFFSSQLLAIWNHFL